MIEGRSAGDGRAGPEAPRAEKTLERRIRAFHWVRLISAVPERCAGSPGEREAGERVAAWLRELGFEDVTQRDVAAGPDPARSIALHQLAQSFRELGVLTVVDRAIDDHGAV